MWFSMSVRDTVSIGDGQSYDIEVSSIRINGKPVTRLHGGYKESGGHRNCICADLPPFTEEALSLSDVMEWADDVPPEAKGPALKVAGEFIRIIQKITS